MGTPKQTLKLAGKPMLQRVIDTFLATDLEEVIVVVSPALGWRPRERKRLRLVANIRSGEGISSSVRTGLEAIDPTSEAAVIGLGDKPLVLKSTIEKLMAAFERTDSEVIVPVYRGRRGNPILFRRSMFEEMGRLKGDKGAKILVEAGTHTTLEVPVRDIGVMVDVDTPDDLRNAARLIAARAELERKSRK